MPEFHTISTDTDGHFLAKFEGKSVTFYGHTVTDVQKFRLYGSFPDNHILANKLVNQLGNNLLSLERENLKLAANTTLSSELKEKTQFYGAMERESNAFTQLLIDAISPLEIERFDKEGKPTFSLGKAMVKPTPEIKKRVVALFEARDKYFKDNQLAELDQHIQTAKSQAEKLPTSANIQQYEKLCIYRDRMLQISEIYTSKKDDLLAMLDSSAPIDLQGLYRQVMDNFADEQRRISVFQHSGLRVFDYANRSLTEGYQDASFAMEKHIFSRQKPSSAQLWHEAITPDTPTLLDTRRYPTIRHDDALLAMNLVNGGAPADITTQYHTQKNSIKNATMARKKELKQWRDEKALPTAAYHTSMRKKRTITLSGSPEDKDIQQVIEKATLHREGTQTEGAIIISDTLTVPVSALRYLTEGDQTYLRDPSKRPEDKEKLAQDAIAKDKNAKADTNRKKADETFMKGGSLLAAESPVSLYQSNDILSAIGLTCIEIGKYPERMAAKHPLVTTVAFTGGIAAFGAAGLVSANAMPHVAEVVLHSLSEALTIHGKIGISTHDMTQGIEAITQEFLKLTYANQSLVKTLIVTGVGMPKLSYIAMDTLINGFDNRDTLSVLAQKMSPDKLSGETDEEKAIRISRNIATVALLLTATTMMGIGAQALISANLSALPAWLATPLHGMAVGVNAFVEVPIEVFQNVGLNSGTAELLAIISLALTIKSSALLLGKTYLLLSHLSEYNPSPEEWKATYLVAELERRYQQNPDLFSFNSDAPNADYYLGVFENLLHRKPDIAEQCDPDFLARLGVYPEQTKKYTLETAAKFVWSRVLKPIGQTALLPLIVFPLLYIGIRDGWTGLKNALKDGKLKDPLGLFSRLITTGIFIKNTASLLWSAAKTLGSATLGAIQRLTMTVGDLIGTLALIANKGILQAIPVGIGYIAGKVGLSALRYVTPVVGLAAKTATSLVIFTSRIAAAAVGIALLPITIGALFNTKAREAITTFFTSTFNDVRYLNGKISQGTQGIIDMLDNGNDALNTLLEKESGAEKIIALRDRGVGGIGMFGDTVKQGIGHVLYEARCVMTRAPEQTLQQMEMDDVLMDLELKNDNTYSQIEERVGGDSHHSPTPTENTTPTPNPSAPQENNAKTDEASDDDNDGHRMSH